LLVGRVEEVEDSGTVGEVDGSITALI
jgi:hypothetical protein